MPDAAIFADTGAEPGYVYDWLERQLPFLVYRVMQDKGLEQAIHDSFTADKWYPAIPFFALSPGSKKGILRRQCTSHFKLKPIIQKTRELLGLKPGERARKGMQVIQWVGISLDEAHRMKPSPQHYIKSIYPLVDNRITRHDCYQWMEQHGYPEPARSACYFCPYHSRTSWRWIKDNHPDEFDRAVKIDALIRTGVRGVQHQLFINDSRQPLDEIDLTQADDHQIDLFGNECEGMCGV